MGYNNIRIKSDNNFHMSVTFWRSRGVAPEIFIHTLLERVLEKMVSILTVLEGNFDADL